MGHTGQRRRKPARGPQRKPGSRVHSELAAGIGRRILDGTYQPGSLLPNEAEWGEIFGASRTAVREAIKTLNGKGLLVSRPKIGSRVEPRERWNLLDRDVMAWHRAALDERTFLLSLQEIRRILEPGAAVLAAQRRSPQQLAALEKALADMQSAVARSEAMVAADVRFHLALLAAANNELLAPFGIVIEQALASMFAYTTSHAVHPEQMLPLHARVVKAIAARAPEAARKAMTELLDDTDETLGAAAGAQA
ncbi:MAG: FadR family transcriptional regulator [Aestuariivirga sp.]|uniref:FadR/GntR family transcriptional regulator n=1 Tax=Aestuariivirga sp. TaxID=2650926 RepID=UPI0025C4FF5D|nr:FadR/GntR family transcriptional regulator [Aestuariivirga sp.]MCA3560579.1 FadR family transcriptional regulator [Aestuariivirga sp.]